MEDQKGIQKDETKMKNLASTITFDKEIYCADRFEGYEQSIPVDDGDDNLDITDNNLARKLSTLTAPKQFLNDHLRRGGEEDEMSGFNKPSKIIDREDEYRRRWRFNRMLSPERVDPFLDKTPANDARTYADVMREEVLKRKEAEVKRLIAKKMKEIDEVNIEQPKKRNRWDIPDDESAGSDWDSLDSTPGIGTWDVTPIVTRRNRWDETPTPHQLHNSDARLKGLARRKRSRWDESPFTMETGVTPVGGVGMATPTPNSRVRNIDFLEFNCNCGSRKWSQKPLTDEELDAYLPVEGYEILEPPPSYVPVGTPATELIATDIPVATPLYVTSEENRGRRVDVPKEYLGLPLNQEHQDKLLSPVVQHSPEVC